MIVPRQSVHVDSPTERRNPRTADIDTLPTLEVLERLNAEDRQV
ncbi:MAG: N-acetylmuramic acid 6-phosphate etherase, partial [Pseudonocardiaceae bacterium]